MKIIKNILKTNAGKLALSAMQTLGIATGVAVAGVGAYFALGPSQDVNPDTVFSSQNDGEVVYVAGHSAAGGYAGVGAPVEGGEIQSGFQAKLSHSLRMMNEETNKPELLEVEEQEQKVAAYKMDGASSGLGVGAGQQGANEAGLAGMGGDMSAIQAQIAALQANAQAQQQQAAAAAAAAGQQAGDAVAAAQAALAGGKLANASAVPSVGGSNLGGEGLQPGSYQASASKPVEGKPIQSALPPASKPTPLYAGGRQVTFTQGAGDMGANALYAMAKHSAAIANKGGDASDVFMGGASSRGVVFEGGNVTTGGGSSNDFGADNVPDFSGAAQSTSNYENAREELRKEIQKFVQSCNNWSYVPFFMWIGYAAKAKARNDMLDKIEKFKEEWGYTNFEKLNSQGGYATVSEGVVREAFNGIWGMGRPKRKAKEWGKKYWDSEEAFTKEDPSNLGSPDIALGDVPTSPYAYGGTKGYGGGTYGGALDIGCSYGVGSR